MCVIKTRVVVSNYFACIWQWLIIMCNKYLIVVFKDVYCSPVSSDRSSHPQRLMLSVLYWTLYRVHYPSRQISFFLLDLCTVTPSVAVAELIVRWHIGLAGLHTGEGYGVLGFPIPSPGLNPQYYLCSVLSPSQSPCFPPLIVWSYELRFSMKHRVVGRGSEWCWMGG